MARTAEHVLLEVDGQRIALPARDVREVLRAVAVTPLAGAQAPWDGVIDYRGAIVPVLSLRSRLGRPPASVGPDQCFVIAIASSRLVALRADRVVAIVTLEESKDEKGGSRPEGASVPSWIAGVTPHPDGLLVMYDLGTFLSADEARAIDEVLASAKTPS